MEHPVLAARRIRGPHTAFPGSKPRGRTYGDEPAKLIGERKKGRGTRNYHLFDRGALRAGAEDGPQSPYWPRAKGVRAIGYFQSNSAAPADRQETPYIRSPHRRRGSH